MLVLRIYVSRASRPKHEYLQFFLEPIIFLCSMVHVWKYRGHLWQKRPVTWSLIQDLKAQTLSSNYAKSGLHYYLQKNWCKHSSLGSDLLFDRIFHNQSEKWLIYTMDERRKSEKVVRVVKLVTMFNVGVVSLQNPLLYRKILALHLANNRVF